MTHHERRRMFRLIPCLLFLWLVPPASAQQLEIGGVITSSTSEADVAVLPFDAPSAGVLTVVVRSMDESDLVLLLTDQDGQPLPEARSDSDLGGDPGAEQLAVTIPRSGVYRVRVESYSVSSRFTIGASWIAFPDLEIPADPDGSPRTAIALRFGQPQEGSLDGTVGDHWDWYMLTAEDAGTVTVGTRSEENDLILEAFEAGDFTNPIERSDRDLQGVTGNEAVTVIVQPEQQVFFKVSAHWTEGGPTAYRLVVGFIPD
jgi:hypothetical protein